MGFITKNIFEEYFDISARQTAYVKHSQDYLSYKQFSFLLRMNSLLKSKVKQSFLGLHIDCMYKCHQQLSVGYFYIKSIFDTKKCTTVHHSHMKISYKELISSVNWRFLHFSCLISFDIM